MVKEIIMYTVVCDGCGRDSADVEEYAGWNDKGYAVDVASNLYWEKIEDNHYCTNCFTHDEQGEIVLTKKIVIN
jgi:hypothetical protein